MRAIFDETHGNVINVHDPEPELKLIECKCCDQIVSISESVPDHTGEFRYSRDCVNSGDALAYEYEQSYPSEWKKIEEYFNELNK